MPFTENQGTRYSPWIDTGQYVGFIFNNMLWVYSWKEKITRDYGAVTRLFKWGKDEERFLVEKQGSNGAYYLDIIKPVLKVLGIEKLSEPQMTQMKGFHRLSITQRHHRRDGLSIPARIFERGIFVRP